MKLILRLIGLKMSILRVDAAIINPKTVKPNLYPSVIVGAETPSPLLKHSLASPSTVAYVMYQKYVNSIPLYRQEADWKQLGVKLPRATLANWVIKCGIDYMEPVYEQLHQHLLERDIIHADETPCQVLKEEGKTAQSKSYMWLYGSGNDGLPPIRLYDYQPSRGGYHGRCSISNNIAENIARPYAVGRKNFLFHDTVKGARASSIIYSLVETAKLNNLNIYAYLETVLLYMPDYKNEPEGIEELMPWSDMIQQRCRIKSKS